MEGPRILVVEDDRDVREVVAEYLQQEGFRASIAENGLAAREWLERESLPDAILLDLLMPTMSGEVFLQWLRRDPRFCDLPVIVITGVSQPAPGARLFADAFLTKPFEVEDLLQALRRMVRTGRGPPTSSPMAP